jgi:cell division protein FtsB
VYEVKVERVIDGRDQIEQLQAAVFELEQQMKLLAQDKDFLA